jgi:ribosomal protein L19E
MIWQKIKKNKNKRIYFLRGLIRKIDWLRKKKEIKKIIYYTFYNNIKNEKANKDKNLEKVIKWKILEKRSGI